MQDDSSHARWSAGVRRPRNPEGARARRHDRDDGRPRDEAPAPPRVRVGPVRDIRKLHLAKGVWNTGGGHEYDATLIAATTAL